MSLIERLFGEYHCPGCTCFDEEEEQSDEQVVEEQDEFGELPVANEPDPQTPPHTHEWGMWEIVKEGNISRKNDDPYDDDEERIGTYLDQRRRCATCGKYELDTQVSYAIND